MLSLSLSLSPLSPSLLSSPKVRADIRVGKVGLGGGAPSRSMDSAGDSSGSGTAASRAH